MLIRRLAELAGGEREATGPAWASRRLLLHGDGPPYSFHDTVLYAGTTTRLWYRNHQAAVYCLGGRGELLDRRRKVVHPIASGVLYVLDVDSPAQVTVVTDLHVVCVFTPALTGRESLDADGSYPLLADDGPTA